MKPLNRLSLDVEASLPNLIIFGVDYRAQILLEKKFRKISHPCKKMLFCLTKMKDHK